MCIISTAQQARPKVKGQIEPLRPQLRRSSSLARDHSATDVCLVPNGEYPFFGKSGDDSITGRVCCLRTKVAFSAGTEYIVFELRVALCKHLPRVEVEVVIAERNIFVLKNA